MNYQKANDFWATFLGMPLTAPEPEHDDPEEVCHDDDPEDPYSYENQGEVLDLMVDESKEEA